MSMIAPGNDFSKRDARRQAEEFPAAQHLACQLIEKSDALAIGSGFAGPGEGIMESGLGNNSARNGNQYLQPWNVLQEDFEAARPVMELLIRMWHEVGV